MTFKTMRYMLAVAEQGSFSGAAKQLYLSQPSLSQSILALEKETGVTLFDRSANPLRLTPAGERFVVAARQILALESGLMADLGAMSAQGRPLRVAASPVRLRCVVADVHHRFQNLHPGAPLSLIEAEDNELPRMLRMEQADLALIEEAAPEDLIGHPVLSEDVVLAVSRMHPAVRDSGGRVRLPLERFARDRFVMPAPSMHLRRCAERLFAGQQFVPRLLFETRSVELMLEYARLGLAVAPVYESAALALHDVLAFCEPVQSGGRTTLFLCHRPALEPDPLMQDFIRLAQQRPGGLRVGEQG